MIVADTMARWPSANVAARNSILREKRRYKSESAEWCVDGMIQKLWVPASSFSVIPFAAFSVFVYWTLATP